MRAVVLVGGEGTRLRPLTLTVPKQALPIVEVPMIERVLAYLAAQGVSDAVLSLGYRHQSFLSLFPDGQCWGLKLSCAIEPEPMGTAGAVRFAAVAAEIDEPCVVVNGDVLTDLDLGALVAFHRERGAEGTIALGPVDDPSAYGQVVADPDGRVRAFLEKTARAGTGGVSMAGAGTGGASMAGAGTGGASMVNAGSYVLEPSAIERIPPGRAVSIEREIFPAMADAGSLYALGSDAYWADTGTPAQYIGVQLDLLSGRRAGSPVAGATLGGGHVWTLGDGVVDGEVDGPAFIGRAAFVQLGARVVRSVLSSGARVYEGARVSDSVLLPGAVVRRGAVVEGSIVGEQAVIGEKSLLSNRAIVGNGVEIPAGAQLVGARVPEG